MDELILASAAALSFVFGWNNSAFLVGNLRGSGALSFRMAVLISVVGLLLGAFLEGPKMSGSLVSSFAPAATTSVLLATCAVSLALTVALSALDLPVSFSMVMVGAFLGAASSSMAAVDVGHSIGVVAYWFAAPVFTAALSVAIYASVKRAISSFGVLTIDSFNRAGAVASSLAVSYALGANNIGLIYSGSGANQPGGAVQTGVMVLLAVVAALGVVTLGRGALGGTIGDRMLGLSPQGIFSVFVASSLVVWAGTQLALPISVTQCLLGGMLGAAYTRKVAVLNRRLVRETVSLWVVAPVAAFVLAYLSVPFL